MKSRHILLIAILILIQNLQLIGQAIDPHRGLQVSHFASFTPKSINDGYGKLNLDFSVLGNTQREDSLLQYACDNHITYLALYDLYEVFKYSDSPGTSVGGKTLVELLCDFMNKARTNYCINEIGVTSERGTFFDDATADTIARYVSSGDVASLDSTTGVAIHSVDTMLYYLLTHSFSLTDSLAESAHTMRLFYNALYSSAGTCVYYFDFMNYEHEWWNIHDFYTIALPDLQHINNLKAVYNTAHTDSIHTAVYVRTGTDTASINIARYLDGTASRPRLADRILAVHYASTPWGAFNIYSGEPGVYADTLTIDSTDYHPYLSVETASMGQYTDYMGVWLRDHYNNNIFRGEDTIYSLWRALPATDFGTQHENQMEPGGVHYFASFFIVDSLMHPRTFKSNSPICTNGAAGDTVRFTYQGPAEMDIKYVLKMYNDSSTLVRSDSGFTPDFSVTQPIKLSLPSYYIPQSGNPYRAELTLTYDRCSYSYSDTVFIWDDATIIATGPLDFCQGGNVVLKAGGGTAWQWHEGASTIVGATNQTYMASVSGNYWCNITNTNGLCGGNTNILSVNVLSNPEITFLTECFNSDSGQISVTSPGSSFLWITGDTTSSIIADVFGGYQYFVTVTQGNGCKRTRYRGFSIPAQLANPDITINGGSLSVCKDSAATIHLSPTQFCVGCKYYWTYNDTTNLTNGGYTISEPDSDTTVTLYMISSTGCDAFDTAQIKIYKCCNPQGTLNLSQDSSSRYGTQILNDTINFFHNFVVNNNFKLRHSIIAMDSATKIIILPGYTLTISDTSHLFSCSSMWEGIILSDSSSALIVDSASIIEDADTAANARFGGSITLQGNDTIRRNLVGISARTAQSNLLVKGAVFDCPQLLNDTSASKYSDTHILLSDADTIIIGDTTHQNKFINAKRGIDATRTWLTIINARILNDTSIIHAPDSASFGIKFIGSASKDFMLNVSNTNFTKIQNYGYGIYSKLETLNQIWFNETDNCQYGVYLENIRDQRSDIRQNTFLACKKACIYLYDISISMGWIHVNENYINLGASSSGDMTEIGVRGENVTPFHTHITVVSNKINNTRYGTRVTSYHDADISSNKITFPQNVTHAHSGEEYFGILAEGSSGLTVDDNTIMADSTPVAGMDTMFRGISLNLTSFNTLQENYLGKMGAGLRILGDCNHTNLYCNTFDSCYNSIYYNSFGKIPQQGNLTQPNDNIFKGNIDSLKATGDNTFHTVSNWYFRGSQTDATNIYNIWKSNPNIVNPIDSTSSKYYKCEAKDTSGGGSGTGSGKAQALANTVSGSDESSGEFANEIRYMDNEIVYRALIDDSTLMYQDAPSDEVLQDFADENSQTNIGFFDEVRTLGEEGDKASASNLNDAISDTNLIEYNSRIVNEIYFDGSVNDTLHLSSNQNETLEDIAYENPVEGGEAVYRARAMLRIYISDSNPQNSYRKSNLLYQPVIQNICKFKVYPVPSTGYFVIKNIDKTEGPVRFIITDNAGRIIRSGIMTFLNEILISTANLNQGVYQLTLKSEKVCENHKLIIVK